MLKSPVGIPASVTETFTTADPNQPAIRLKPFQGESPLVSFNQRPGHFDVTEIPPANPGEPLIYAWVRM